MLAVKRLAHPLQLAFILAYCCGVGACTQQSRFSPIGLSQPARPENCQVDVYRYNFPDRPYTEVSRLDVHLEKTHFVESALDDAIADLKHQACLSGADAIINIRERRSMLLETRIYHVTATGIRYTN